MILQENGSFVSLNTGSLLRPLLAALYQDMGVCCPLLVALYQDIYVFKTLHGEVVFPSVCHFILPITIFPRVCMVEWVVKMEPLSDTKGYGKITRGTIL